MLNQNPRQSEFVLGTCPHCQKVVRIPATAATSQSSSHVGCPICSESFELASVLEDMIPAVKVVDEPPQVTKPKPVANEGSKQPKRINAIDTPELFHSLNSKDEYEPTTEKKNGRFVVPELLSKGIDKKKKRKKSRRRRSSNDPDVAKSLAKLRENTSSTSLDRTPSSDDSVHQTGGMDEANVSSSESERSSSRGERSKSERSSSSRKKNSSRKPSSNSRAANRSRSKGLFGSILSMPRMLRKNVRNNLSSDAESDSTRGDIIMLVIGAMIAIPMLHLVLWWFVGLDPLGLAKPTAKVIPFIVPNSMRSETGESTIQIESQQSLVGDENFFESGSAVQSADGKLPKPSIDPSSVHADDVN